jgi:hypothetical protein
LREHSHAFSDISHERQQSLLRQRNLFALTSAGLGLALVIAGSLAATRDREVVLVPTSSQATHGLSAGVEADYLELVTRDAALCSSIAARKASITGWRDPEAGGSRKLRAAQS